MSSITFADNKLGGRIVAACDAMAAGHLHKAASIFSEITEELNAEATASLSEEEAESSMPVNSSPSPPAHAQHQDLQMCARNVHSYGEPDPMTGWRECRVCGNVNVAPPGDGPIDMGARNL